MKLSTFERVLALPRWAHYAVSLIVTLLALYFRYILDVQFHSRPLLIFFVPPITVSAIIGGMYPGILSTFLCACCLYVYFIPKTSDYLGIANHDFIQLLFLILSGIIVSILSDRLINIIIKEKKEAQKLQISEELYRTILYASMDGYILFQYDGKILDTNHAYCEMVNYSRDEILSNNIFNFEALGSRGDINSHLQSAMADREDRFTSRHCRKDGSEYDVELSIQYRRKDGRFVVFLRDITVNMNAEKELRESKMQLQSVADSVPAMVAEIDMFERYVFVNKAYLEWCGMSIDYVIGRKIQDIVGDERYVIIMKSIYRALSGEKHVQQDCFKLVSGEIQYVKEHYIPIYKENNEVAGCYLMGQDITELKVLEKDIVQAKEVAEAGSRVKSEFLANMSHEIRTPLNGMVATLELLKTTTLNPDQDQLAGTAITSCHRLAQLLSDILDISRIEAGKLRIQPCSMSVKNVFFQTRDLFSPVAKEKELDMVFHVDPALPDRILGDDARLQQVLINMVGNALKFTHEGAINVSAFLLPIKKHKQHMVLFSVEDTGIGMSDESIEELFKAFFQASEGYTRNHQGAGLGLSICKRLVELMGGSICVVSELGLGSSFWFSLPFGFVDQGLRPTSRAADISESLNLSSLSILLVDDDLVSAFATSRLLEKQGIQVCHVENGALALEALRERNFNLVLMDVQMPVMDGVTATHAIRSGEAGEMASKLPIIALTAYAMESDIANFMKAGMNDYLSKPVRSENLEAGIRKWLSDDHKKRGWSVCSDSKINETD
ncbi:Sensor histidine kinase RcsC [anaerobic digester metagenome]